MAMTLEQVRDWAAKTPASNGWQAKERDDAVAALSAHLTQPAQAVDVGVIREVIETLRTRKSMFSGDLGAEADKLIRALSAEKAGWRDIATAPNDGTVVLLAIEKPGYSGMALAYQKDGQWHSEESDAAFGGWTHWMPLPASPTPDKEGA